MSIAPLQQHHKVDDASTLTCAVVVPQVLPKVHFHTGVEVFSVGCVIKGRYEVNNDFRKALTEHGMMLSGLSPDGRIVEMIEIPDHPWFLATQAHPEFKSRPNRPHPLFRGFIEAALKNSEGYDESNS